MIVLENRSDLKPNTKKLETYLRFFTDKQVELLLTHSEEIRSLNKRYRHKDHATDVLSFPLSQECEGYLAQEERLLGSIAINVDALRMQAKEFAHTDEEELALLFIHGVLHLLGYDHEADSGQMRQKELEAINHFDLPESLIIRSQGV